MTTSQIENLRLLFEQYNVLDGESNWYYLNRLWYDMEPRESFIKILERFWKEEIKPVEKSVVIIPEGISSSFGILPAVSRLVYDFDYTLVIWKEFGDILTVEPYIFPGRSYLEERVPGPRNCIVLQDVINKGTTLSKMADQLKRHKWKIQVYAGVIQFPESVKRLKQSVDENPEVLSSDFRIASIAFVDSDGKFSESKKVNEKHFS